MPSSRAKFKFSFTAFLILTMLFCVPRDAAAQKEASVWSLGYGKQLNFQDGFATLDTFQRKNGLFSTICDQDGNLMLYTNGHNVWNRNDEVLFNGTGLVEDERTLIERPVFVPYPGKEGRYLLFYETVPKGGYSIRDKKLVYAVIDTRAASGRGEVLEKNVFLHLDYHHTFSIAGYCNNSYYWLLIESDDNVTSAGRDRIYFFRIDESGVHHEPKINGELDMGHSGGYRFSPNGDKFCFSYGDNRTPNVYQMLADFDFSEGKAYNIRVLLRNDFIRDNEFSPNSNLLYSFVDSILVQTDVRYSSGSRIRNSRENIYVFDSTVDSIRRYPMGLELAPDGKIYFTYFDMKENVHKLGRINFPNKKGKACGLELDAATLGFNINPFFPNFVKSFFRDKQPEFPDEVFPDAGPPINICTQRKVTIGKETEEQAFYNWIPDADVTEPFLPVTGYNPDIRNDKLPMSIPITLRATDGNCWVHFDETAVNVLPTPEEQPVDGSWSVCPGVEQVDYRTKDPYIWFGDGETTLHWLVEGGEIDSVLSPDSVKINWGGTNRNAQVAAYAVNGYGCVSDTSVFPVRINVELITETPKGPDNICVAQSDSVTYQIRETNGSVYRWTANGGTITSGQGTHRVQVDWQGEGTHYLFVEETSETIDTICYGESEPLAVNIRNDSLELTLRRISFDIDNNLQIFYKTDGLDGTIHKVYLQTTEDDGESVRQAYLSHQLSGTYSLPPGAVEMNPVKIWLKAINSCDEIFYSRQLETVVLNGRENETAGTIELEWNINQFWAGDRITHEIWHSTSRKEGWKLIAGDVAQTLFDLEPPGLALTHYFRIKEINLDKNTETWSNVIRVNVSDELIIPDVFTPNADGINDTWEISKIQFSDLQSAVVYNRLGEVVYQCKNEFVPWDGKISGKVQQGTYFYQLTFGTGEIRYGQLTILQ